MSRRVIQPPGGTSNIFFGGDEPNSNGSGKGKQDNQAKNGQHADSQQGDVKKQTSESSESTLGKSTQPDQSGHANNESNRNKDRQKSTIVFGNEDTASQSAAHNKAGQTHRSYNLITGETEVEKKPNQPASNGNQAAEAKNDSKSHDAAPVAGTTSIKVHHPPGGKSSGPLW